MENIKATKGWVFIRDYEEYPVSFDPFDPESWVDVKVGDHWETMGQTKNLIRELTPTDEKD